MSLVKDLADTLRAVVAASATKMPIDAILPEVKAVLERAEAYGSKHCDTCICGRRAPVQYSRPLKKAPGSIAWEEHMRAWSAYDAKWRCGQTAERIAERGGFGYEELVEFLGGEPKTWEPR